MRIASTVQNNIWWNYVDQEEYFEMAEGDGRRYLPDVPRPHSYEMKEFDYHVSEICDFLQTFTVLIVSVAGSIIAVFLFYKHIICRYAFFQPLSVWYRRISCSTTTCLSIIIIEYKRRRFCFSLAR